MEAIPPEPDLSTLRSSGSLTITRKDAAAALGVDPRTVTAGIESGAIPAVKLGRRVLIPRAKFLKLFEALDD
ncbi:MULTISPECIES: helix-turn-helix domain-containing protein [unclassified Leucobacter]|uniref:helix-turn-helix domain-containing protein n=1 Tax=unclassified Leucobacter TaxID=2621730 RepID=UPI00165D64DE|nr:MULTISPECIES: helix-turn-helix domain-containing protein [unclassified Leucobacter]MBC9927413.1 helix-turn-helix domain-containing protein [Leucobacter sp. cx-169]